MPALTPLAPPAPPPLPSAGRNPFTASLTTAEGGRVPAARPAARALRAPQSPANTNTGVRRTLPASGFPPLRGLGEGGVPGPVGVQEPGGRSGGPGRGPLSLGRVRSGRACVQNTAIARSLQHAHGLGSDHSTGISFPSLLPVCGFVTPPPTPSPPRFSGRGEERQGGTPRAPRLWSQQTPRNHVHAQSPGHRRHLAGER